MSGFDGFDEFDGLGSDDGMGDFEPLDDGGSGDSSGFSNFDSFGDGGQEIDSTRLEGAMNINQFNNGGMGEQSAQGTSIRKQAIIAIVAGVMIVLIVLIVAVTSSKKKNTGSSQPAQEVKQTQTNSGQSPNEILGSSDVTGNGVAKYTLDSGGLKWTEIPGNEVVDVSEDFQETGFLITGVKHYARVVDGNNNLVIKTVLTGGIDGLSGQYTLEVPYDKGIKVPVGEKMNVYCRLGTYNGKTVLVELKY